jgi:hypothetical protein
VVKLEKLATRPLRAACKQTNKQILKQNIFCIFEFIPGELRKNFMQLAIFYIGTFEYKQD